MSGFDRRREGFEAKLALDEEQKFRATARRNRLVGSWAAAQLGLTGAAADEYALSVVKSDLREPGDADIIRKIASDFRDRGVTIGEDAIREQLAARMHEAVEHVTSQPGPA